MRLRTAHLGSSRESSRAYVTPHAETRAAAVVSACYARTESRPRGKSPEQPKAIMTSRSLSKLLAAGATSLALAAGSAHAATYELTFTGTDVSGDIFATTTGTDVTSISGW